MWLAHVQAPLPKMLVSGFDGFALFDAFAFSIHLSIITVIQKENIGKQFKKSRHVSKLVKMASTMPISGKMVQLEMPGFELRRSQLHHECGPGRGSLGMSLGEACASFCLWRYHLAKHTCAELVIGMIEFDYLIWMASSITARGNFKTRESPYLPPVGS